jgi:hypothetical protein
MATERDGRPAVPMPPKFDPQRGTRGRGPVQLPAEGRQGEPPAWPIPGRATAAEVKTWEMLWATPQAVAWEKMGAGTVWEVARYCRTSVAATRPGALGMPGGASLVAQATAMADRLGLTPKSMRLLLWEIVSPDIEPQQVGGSGARGRIKAV